MPGPSSSTTHLDAVVGGRARRRCTRAVAYFSAFSTRLATICASRCGSARRAARRRPRRPARCRARRPTGRNASTASATTARASIGAGSQRELVGVEAGEVEEVGDEPLEPARLRRDHLGGADARVRALDRAVGDRLGVAADRRERRAQVVRHAQQERALVPLRLVELGGHRVDRVREAAELVVAHVGLVDPGREVAAGDRRARSSPSPRSVGSGGARGTAATSAAIAERDDRGAEHRAARCRRTAACSPRRRARAPASRRSGAR